MLKRQWDRARNHLLQAIACESGSPIPALTFVELYVETKEYLSAVEALDNALEGSRSRPLNLLELANDLAERGTEKESRICFERVIKRDVTGVSEELAKLRILDLTSRNFTPLSDAQLESYCNAGIQAIQRGEAKSALDAFFRVLSLRPREGRVWFFVGYILNVGIMDPGRFLERLNSSVKLSDIAVDEARHKELLQAEEALNYSCLFNPELIEARVQLASCYLLLDKPEAVIECAEAVFQAEHQNVDAYALLSQILLGIGDLSRAAEAAYKALTLDPNDSLSLRTLSVIELLLQKMEGGDG